MGYAFATTGAVAVALGLNHLTKVKCSPLLHIQWASSKHVLITQLLDRPGNCQPWTYKSFWSNCRSRSLLGAQWTEA